RERQRARTDQRLLGDEREQRVPHHFGREDDAMNGTTPAPAGLCRVGRGPLQQQPPEFHRRRTSTNERTAWAAAHSERLDLPVRNTRFGATSRRGVPRAGVVRAPV